MVWLNRLIAGLTVLSGAEHVAAASPRGALGQPGGDVAVDSGIAHPFADYPPVNKARQEDGPDLRILPLGASIMSGVGSPEHSGLRKWVRMALRYDGWDVNMVGHMQDGDDMTDTDHEALPGDVLSQIRERLQWALGYNANLVIINGGTNNANAEEEPDRQYIHDEMNAILTDVWNHPATADTCIILSTLLPTTHPNGAPHRIAINDEYRKLVQEHENDKCIYLADMEPEGEGEDFLSTERDIWSDEPKVHPNNEGHKRVAYVFYAAINRALCAGKVPSAAPIEVRPEACAKLAGNDIPAGMTQKGFGHDDGIYQHSDEEMGVILEIDSAFDRNQWRFARLFSRNYDDLIGWFELSETEHRFGVWKNSADGEGSFRKIDDLDTRLFCIPRGLHFIDMNADGLDDAVCIHPDGALYLSINEGNGSGDTLPTFRNIGRIKDPEETQARVRLADIDGDGRGDYGVIRDNGDIEFWRNGWVNDAPDYWQPLGLRSMIRAPDNASEPFPGIRFEDINGDGRDDWMWLSTAGQTTTHTSSRSCQKGEEGDGLNVAWRQGFAAGESSGPTHRALEAFQEDGEDLRNRIHFARIYGTKPAFGNYGVQDYVFVERVQRGDNEFTFRVRAWKNDGSGSTQMLADGNKYCNMKGHEDGLEDYVWMWPTGGMILFPNLGKTSVLDNESFWGPREDIWTPPADLDRRDVHLADWDNDGACDVIWVNPDNGNVRVWVNSYPGTQLWVDAFTEIEPPTLTCGETRGLGIHDLAVRIADITGNGRADYLCIEKDGRVSGAVQDDDGAFEQIPQIKFAEDADRANIRFTDVNGDGRDDMLWVDKFSGDAEVWYNQGRGDPDELNGSSFRWDARQKVWNGRHAGTCEYFPDLDGDGRADQHSVRGTFNNEADSYLSPSCEYRDVQGDDPEGVVDPELPVQPGNPVERLPDTP